MEPIYTKLKDSLSPCEHFKGACKGVCHWCPKKGYVPRGYGTSARSINEIELVVVTAEPADPLDEEQYGADLDENFQSILNNFNVAMTGVVTRGGRKNMFHDRLCELLNIFWPNEALEEQMRRVWFTDSVLCSKKCKDHELSLIHI